MALIATPDRNCFCRNTYTSHENFNSKFSTYKGLITWRISARAEISTRLTGLKFCCDYMTILIPGRNISLGTKYEIAREESQENQNGTENTNRENRRIASLAVWSFGGAQFSAFWDGNSLQDDGTEAKPVFGYISLS